MFRGRFEHSVDQKGRVAFPARFRDELLKSFEDERLVVTPHLKDPCLVVYPHKEWEAFEERLAKLSQLDPKVTVLRRLYVGRAHECALDKQGRVLIAPELRRDAGIEHEAVWSGAARFVELWSKPTYEAHVAAIHAQIVDGQLGDVLEKLAELGI